ncbi:DUF4270 family protein [uncultured Porphyromonas sp.]|uniref:DUF4270 family protein n=1 Tax=uncultured Porphyromonas sp. TaxID=159274 RepID=UPI0025CB9775|nr:DUF4270 family protein [uncultured Porphyromonas sp.]
MPSLMIKMTHKLSLPLASLLVGVCLLLVSCEDRSNTLGVGMMPDYTQFKSFDTTFDLSYRTISADMKDSGSSASGTQYNRMYVSSNYGYIGRIPNQEFGGIETEYLTQMYCPEGFLFRDQPVDNRIDSAFLTLYYDGYSGYGKDLVEVTAYRLDRPLPGNSKYSLESISDYYTRGVSKELGRASFMAVTGTPHEGKGTWVRVPIAREIGQDFYDKSVAGSEVFRSQAAFDQYFPGVYFRVSAGTGSVIRVVRTALTFCYRKEQMLKRRSTGKVDSLAYVPAIQELSHTNEVPQLSRFANMGLSELMAPGSDYAYVKSPAGVLAEITIPTREIKKKLDEAPKGSVRVLASAPFSISGENRQLSEYQLVYPTSLVLMPRDSVAHFFESELTDADSPFTTYVSRQAIQGSSTYTFGNISALISKHIEKKPDEDLRVVVVPVQYVAPEQQQSGAVSPSSVTNLVLPSTLKIKMDGKNNKLRVYINERKEGSPF